MAITKLSQYNDALLALGERQLATLTDESEARRALDAAYDGALDYCLSIVKPKWASVVKKIDTFTTDANMDFANVFSLPADYVAIVKPYSDPKLDEEVTRYILQGRKFATDHSILYLRYISNTASGVADFTAWSPTFLDFFTAYLANKICPRIKPDGQKDIAALLSTNLTIAREFDKIEETTPRSKPTTNQLTTEWLQIYNDAMFCMSLPQVITINDDSNARAALDAAVNQGAVKFLMEGGQWVWANTSKRLDYDQSITPEWGYQYAFNKPEDMYRLKGIFADEYFHRPKRDYADEGDNWFTDIQTIYVLYVGTALLNSPEKWPQYFRSYLSSYLATQCAGVLGGDVQNAFLKHEIREGIAKNDDAMASPPRRIPNGSWSRARTTALGRNGSGRP